MEHGATTRPRKLLVGGLILCALLAAGGASLAGDPAKAVSLRLPDPRRAAQRFHWGACTDACFEDLRAWKERSLRRYKAKGGEYPAWMEEMDKRELKHAREEVQTLHKVLAAYPVDLDLLMGKYEDIMAVLNIPKVVTVVAATPLKGVNVMDILVFSQSGKIVYKETVRGPEENVVDAEPFVMFPHMFWFSPGASSKQYGVVISWVVGNTEQRLYAAATFTEILAITPPASVSATPHAVVARAQLCPSEKGWPPVELSRVFLGDVNGDGYTDVVFWRKVYDWVDRCRAPGWTPVDHRYPYLMFSRDEYLLALFDPMKGVYLAPDDEEVCGVHVPRLPKSRWYNLLMEFDSDQKHEFWPRPGDAAEYARLDSHFCPGQQP